MPQNRISIIDLTSDSPKPSKLLPKIDLTNSTRNSLSNVSINGDIGDIIVSIQQKFSKFR